MIYNQELFEKCLIFAIKAHRGQSRKFSRKPYILHPFRIVHLLYDIKMSSNIWLLAIACLLHDTVEDCDIKLSTIARLFGHKVAAIVEELTSDKEMIKKMGKTEYLKMKMTNMSSYSLVIKLIDRYDNCSDFKTASKEFVDKYTTQTIQIFDHIKVNRKLTKTHEKIITMIEDLLH